MLNLVLLTDELAQELQVDTQRNNINTFEDTKTYISKLGFKGNMEFWYGGTQIVAKQSVSAYLHSPSIICRLKPLNAKAELHELIYGNGGSFTVKNFFYQSVANFYDSDNPGTNAIANNRPGVNGYTTAEQPSIDNVNRLTRPEIVHHMPQTQNNVADNSGREYTLDKRQNIKDTGCEDDRVVEPVKTGYASRDGKGDYSLKHGKFTKSNVLTPNPIQTKPMQTTNELKNRMSTFDNKSKVLTGNKDKHLAQTNEFFVIDSKPNIKKAPAYKRLVEEDLLLSSSSEVSDQEKSTEQNKPKLQSHLNDDREIDQPIEERYKYVKMDVDEVNKVSYQFLINVLVCFRLITFQESNIPSITDNIYGIVTQNTPTGLKVRKVLGLDKDLQISEISTCVVIQQSSLILISDKLSSDYNLNTDDTVIVKRLSINDNEEELSFDSFYTLYYLFQPIDNIPCIVITNAPRADEGNNNEPELTIDKNAEKSMTNHTEPSMSLTKLEKLIGQQVDFYFSDKNYYKDKYIQERVSQYPDHGLAIDDLLTFNRIKNFKTNYKRVKSALEKYQMVNETTFRLLDNDRIVKK